MKLVLRYLTIIEIISFIILLFLLFDYLIFLKSQSNIWQSINLLWSSFWEYVLESIKGI